MTHFKKLKRRVKFILINWVKYYTKEVAKTLKLITISLAIVITVVYIKYKPVYKVTISGETIGFIENRKVMEAKLEECLAEKELLQELKGKEDVTLDGKHLKLYANIGNPGDVANVLRNDAKGIGLFRSEFLYLESDDFPTEEFFLGTVSHIIMVGNLEHRTT